MKRKVGRPRKDNLEAMADKLLVNAKRAIDIMLPGVVAGLIVKTNRLKIAIFALTLFDIVMAVSILLVIYGNKYLVK